LKKHGEQRKGKESIIRPRRETVVVALFTRTQYEKERSGAKVRSRPEPRSPLWEMEYNTIPNPSGRIG